MSPFGEAGLLGDPLYWATGGDDGNYAKFMRKTWEKPNEFLSPYVTKFHDFERKNPWLNPIQAEIDKTEFGGKIKGMSENKPGDAALAILGAVFGGGALLSGMGGGAGGASSGVSGGSSASQLGGLGGWGGGTNSGLGLFANGGQAGMAGVGGGNAGLLATSGGISGGAGIGSATASSPMGMQDYMKMAQSLGGQQQQQQPVRVVGQPTQPKENPMLLMQLRRQIRAQQLRRKVGRTPEKDRELRELTQGLLNA